MLIVIFSPSLSKTENRGFTVTHNAIRVGEVPVNDVTFVDCCQVLDTSLQRSPDYQKIYWFLPNKFQFNSKIHFLTSNFHFKFKFYTVFI